MLSWELQEKVYKLQKHKYHEKSNCDKAFSCKSGLKMHTSYVHEKREPDISCPKCPKMLISERRLEQHLLIHNNTVFKCSFEGCDSQRSLKASINSHFREKHGKVNHRKSMMERYKTTANEKVACRMCSQVIKRKSLDTHIKSHENKESIYCIIQGCSEIIYRCC